MLVQRVGCLCHSSTHRPVPQQRQTHERGKEVRRDSSSGSVISLSVARSSARVYVVLHRWWSCSEIALDATGVGMMRPWTCINDIRLDRWNAHSSSPQPRPEHASMQTTGDAGRAGRSSGRLTARSRCPVGSWTSA